MSDDGCNYGIWSGSGSHSVDISLERFEVSQLYLFECVPQPSTLPRRPALLYYNDPRPKWRVAL